jgi:iron complex outermembrane receptor protein
MQLLYLIKMKIKIFFTLLFVGFAGLIFAQKEIQDSTLQDVIIISNRLPILMKNNPGAVSIVRTDVLSSMPRSAAVEEALRLVPGVRIDNQHDGERIHLSIRGQGILTERGLRGIGVMIDGIPVNDPSGFAPDLYDVDFATLKNIEVMRGPAASLYGGSGAAGMLNITTQNGSSKPFGGELSETVGSHGFMKSLLQFDGAVQNMDYRISYSRTDGDGYRDHQAFWGNKLYEKINFHPTQKLKITQIFSHTDYFQQNPEGLALEQLDNPLQANPDARPFNEYQKTNRNTFGLVGSYQFSNKQDVQLSSFYRTWNYKETSNACAEYRTYVVPGVSAQYNLHLGSGNVKNNFSLGTDMKWQNINMYKLLSGSDPNRAESIDETNIETDTLLANQTIAQSSIGAFALYKLEIGKFNLLGSVRYDAMKNELTDKMLGLDSAKTSKNFTKTTARIGASYNFADVLTVFANWSQGFLPPSTEELASNPVGYSGFNTHLVPATSDCSEIGIRGFYKDILFYEITGFVMNTKNDFFRFKQDGRGNQEVFYGNAGNSKRNGIETFVSVKILKKLNLQVAYTYADYKYTSATIDPVYTDPAYVLTSPPASGQWLPNSPKHLLYSELVYTVFKNFKVSLGTEYQSKWAIYTDSKAYSGQLDPAIYQNWQDGFNLFNAHASYLLNFKKFSTEFSVSARNFTGVKYMAFTEPDPDGNSYQPGPKQEFFGNIIFRF